MLKKVNRVPYLVYGALAALVYSTPVFFFLRDALFTEAWLLYLGNFLFSIIITLFLFHFNNKRNKNAGTLVMLAAGNITAGIGIVIACIICFIQLLYFVPDLFQPGTTGKVLEQAPSNTIEDKTSGLAFMVFANAIIGNISTGVFVSIIFPFSLKGDQTKEKVLGKQDEL